MKQIFILLILGHILGDYYFQNEKLAHDKQESKKKLLKHCIYYSLAIFLVFLPVYQSKMTFFLLFYSLSHLIIDFLKYYLSMSYEKNQVIKSHDVLKIFLMDQLTHLISILIFSYLMAQNLNLLIFNNPIIPDFMSQLGLSIKGILQVLLTFLLLHKPMNIAISLFIKPYEPHGKKHKLGNSDKNAGRFIGTLERLIIVVFLYLESYSAIGLVMTAKSIFRYEKITEDAAFSEYYLLGTLLSTLFVIVAHFILTWVFIF